MEQRCPACAAPYDGVAERVFSVQEAATHLVPPSRDIERHRALLDALQSLWAGDSVAISRCSSCGFGFANPFRAGTSEIYALITRGYEHYPTDRFEFAPTIAALRDRPAARLLEIGAGKGAFLRQARQAGVIGDALAVEYNDGAIAQLNELLRTESFQGSVQELAERSPEPFDVVCLFQVLEHLDAVDGVFGSIRQLTTPTGRIYLSVPNPPHVEAQERLTGYWDIPPVHIGRWTYEALAALADRQGFTIRDHRFDESDRRELWSLAKGRWEARAYRDGSLNARVNGLTDRRVRGALKRTLALWDLLVLSRHFGSIPPGTQWFSLERA